MNNSVNKILKIIALAIVAFLLIDTVSKIDISSSKNDLLLFKKKKEIDALEDATEVKYKAKDTLDTVRRKQEDDSTAAIINMNLLIILVCIQVYLNYYGNNSNKAQQPD
ncbi:hypothetical protein [Mucilaginibacter terrae]|uniref:Uncharacterized protein n=1 Tax=Mucilaginibacter terrae TaxID=1955052 RepID=A0ABU3GST2_9SPHI|nr:hypothetical protein [Mucilaginibacter terrae]MDT3402838.1 hypothetical protein [Mucilaginibacter terrae]